MPDAELDDPLRQGDLLDGVFFPMLKQPLQRVRIESTEGILAPAKAKLGLVVSQCCDNVVGDYLAIAQVQPRSNFTEEQLEALFNDDPLDGATIGYAMTDFRLDPIDDVLPFKNERTHWVAQLNRIAPFWGDECGSFRQLRRARMTPAGRRLLRINLGLLWSRVEEEDASALDALGLPHMLRLADADD